MKCLLGCAVLVTLTGCASIVGDARTFAPTSRSALPAMAAARAANPSPGPAVQAVPASGFAPHGAGTSGDGGGSIYASAMAGGGNRGLRLFQDTKAREVGDLLTVVLVENTRAKTNANTAVTKDSGVGMSAPSIFGQDVTYKGKSILQAEIEGSRSFGGAGNSAQSNELDGDITVTVVEHLGNGNLRVAGEKHVRLNQGDELVQLQGIVRIADIGPDNRITSDRVGEAQILYGGRGTLARSNAMGWLGRFFNSAAFPY